MEKIMTKCKKLLITLLSVVCVVAFALGLTACGGNDGETYTVTVTDTTDAKTPIANVWIELFYNVTKTVEGGENVDPEDVGQTYIVQETLTRAKTDANGVVKFVATSNTPIPFGEFKPVAGAEYFVKVAQSGETANDRAVPYNYILHTVNDEVTHLPITYFGFDGEKNAKVEFDYVPEHFYYSERPLHPYYREFAYNGQNSLDNPEAAFKESADKVLQLNVKAGEISYFDFSTFKNPRTVGTTDINPDTGLPYTPDEASAISVAITNMSTLAATGKYKLTISTTTASATPVLRHFYASPGYTPVDKNGRPTQILAITGNGSDDKYTGTDYIELDLDLTKSAASYYFYVTSATDCTVSITVERTGEATSRGEIDTEIVQPSTMNPPEFAKEKNLTAVPVDGSVEAVLGDDGYYHMNSKDGKIIAVMLTKTDVVGDRIGDAINTWTNALISDEENNKVYDYKGLINFYTFFVNADGVYGLNEDLYKFLQTFADRFAGASVSNKENNWLLPCVYYAESNTQINPGTANLTYEGEDLYFSFTVQEDGWYIFEGAVPVEIERITVDGNNVFESYNKTSTAFKVEAGKVYNVIFYFDENEAIYGETYSVTLNKTENENNNKLKVGEELEVKLIEANETEVEFIGDNGTYTIEISSGMGIYGQEITAYVGEGPTALELKFNQSNNFTVNVTLNKGDLLYFYCANNVLEASLYVKVTPVN